MVVGVPVCHGDTEEYDADNGDHQHYESGKETFIRRVAVSMYHHTAGVSSFR